MITVLVHYLKALNGYKNDTYGGKLKNNLTR